MTRAASATLGNSSPTASGSAGATTSSTSASRSGSGVTAWKASRSKRGWHGIEPTSEVSSSPSGPADDDAGAASSPADAASSATLTGPSPRAPRRRCC